MSVVIYRGTFLHIPKCGGTWVVRALVTSGLWPMATPGGQHEIAATEGRFVYTFVRHPLTWYPSFWNYRWREAERLGGPIDERLREAVRKADMEIDDCLVDEAGIPRPFAGFVEECLRRHPGYLSRMFERYVAPAHFVGRQESLCEDFLAALRQAGAFFDADTIRRIPRVNESSPKYPAVYPPGLADRLLAAEADAVKWFYNGRAPAVEPEQMPACELRSEHA
jgi:hypothetical protein